VFVAPFIGLYVAEQLGVLGVLIGVLVSATDYVPTPYLWRCLGS